MTVTSAQDLESQMVPQETYWKNVLGSESPLVEIWADHPRPPVSSFIREVESVPIAPMLCNQIQDFCTRENVTPAVMLLAAFKTLLHRYTGQEDIIVLSPFTGSIRWTAGKGPQQFTNLLVLRSSLSDDPSFITLLKQISQVVESAAIHRDYPFDRLLNLAAHHQRAGTLRFYNVMFAIHATEPGLPVTITQDDLGEVEEHTNRCDLFFLLSKENGNFTIAAQYDAELFEPETIIRFLQHYRVLLGAILTDPTRRVSTLPILTEEERTQLLLSWNNSARDFPKASSLHGLVETQVERKPNAIAAVFEGQQLTYRQLNERANRLAHYLKKSGVGPATLVGICLERSLELVIGLLGILKAGGAYVPLDPGYPQERLRFVLDDARAKVIVTQESLLDDLPRFDVPSICVDKDWAAIGQESSENLVDDLEGDARAYVIYTSGSTGNPKGVQITHNALQNFLRSMAEQPGMNDRDVLLAVTTISFDIAGLELFLPLSVGARVVLVSREVATDAVRLMRALEEFQPTVMQATPASWRMLLDAGWQGSQNLKILCGGEAFPGDLAKQLMGKGQSLWNLYGPTESTIWSTLYRVESVDRSVPIGRPIANTEVYILDRHLQPVPIGVAGEVHIGGAGLAQGYLNRPELTEEKFIRHPFNEASNTRLYKTGDLARYLPDGNIEYLNRLDHQVKVRGFRIELGEIESALLRHPWVKDCVTVVREDAPGDRRLVAYIITQSETQPPKADLRNFLKATLPDYMMPAAFMALPAFPLTPNGKIDRRALPPPDASAICREDEFIAPRTAGEETLARIWAQVLKLERVGVEDNFFDLGGHSFLMGQVQLQLEKQLGQKVSLVDLFRYPTIKTLGEFLNQGSLRQRDQSADQRAQKQRSALRIMQQGRTAS